ncbi:MAG: prepilin-type N-terminal cleavage/methylation domain-containing protein [Gammaproteobacteria bacterium]
MVNTKQKGFTLVEIAIVLVIIGLLLGGILKGQELINSARVRNLADQNSGTQAAYYGFIDRYRAVPGDMTAANACNAIGASNLPTTANCTGTPAIGGNGNGSLDAEDYPEAAALWAQLAGAGFIQGSFTGIAANDAAYVASTVAPVNAFNGRVMLTRSDSYAVETGTPSARLAFVFGNQIPVSILRELDVKIDDSQPATGVLRHTDVTGGTTVFNTTAACVTAGTPDIWNIDGAEQSCNAMFIY